MTREDRTLPDGRVISEHEMLSLINESKDWVKRMLERACVPACTRGNRLIEDALKEIVQVYVKYGTYAGGRITLGTLGQQKVDLIIRELIRQLESDIYAYAGAAEEEEDDKEALVAWLKEEYKEGDTESRTRGRVYMLLKNFDDLAAEEARSNDGIISSDIATGMMGIVGVGAIGRLVETEVARAWQHAWKGKHGDKQFVHVFRGSSFNCPICDSVVAMGWQDVSMAVIPPIHPNCMCYCVYA